MHQPPSPDGRLLSPAIRRLRFLAGCILVFASGLNQAATFTVDSTADTFDAGNTTCATPCTLRQAITVANNTAGADTIAFNIPGAGEQVITVTTPLPSLLETAAIDGYTQPGSAVNTSPNAFNAVIRVRIQGVGLASIVRGIAFCASNSSVRGLSIGGFPAGQVIGGTRADGTACPSTPTQLTIAGNLIGLGVDGNTDLGGAQGITLLTSNQSIVGGNSIADRNVISGFTNALTISNSATGVQVLNNLFGTNAADTATVPNSGAIFIGGLVTDTTIGTLAAPNLIAGNASGIAISNTANNIRWTGNLFRINTPGLAIDLNNNGAVNPNDADDTDTGANALQNFPVITSAVPSGPDLVVSGALDVGNVSDLPYELSVYATDRCDESGHGEGEILLGVETRNLRTTAEGFSITVPYSGPTSGRRAITMLARHPTNGSSEFSQCFRFDPAAPLVVNTTDDLADGFCSAAHCSLRDALLQAAAEPGHDVVTFAIPGSGPHRIVPGSAYPNLSQPVTIDGYTQPGASVNTAPLASNAVLRIIIDLSATTQTLFNATVAGSTIRGLSIVNGPANGSPIVSVSAATTITGNWFGAEPDGLTSTSLRRFGITVNGSGSVIGGAAAADRNVFASFFNVAAISGNDLAGSNLTVENNLFGLLPDGQTAARNTTSVSWLSNNTNPVTIRNNTFGCATVHLAAAGTLVESNRFGLAADGLTAPGGDCTPGTITTRSGMLLRDNRISATAGNGRGIDVAPTVTGVVFDRNRIFNISTLEIDLGNDGPTANDVLDPDTGANNRQNHPLIDRAQRLSPTQLSVSGSLNSSANTRFRLQFFADETVRRITGGQPYANARWVSDDELVVTTDVNGNASFSGLVLDFPDAGFLGTVNATATRLDAGDNPVETSELSPAQTTFDPAEDSFIVTNTNPVGAGSFTAAMLAAEANPDDDGQRDFIRFDIPGTGPFVITPSLSAFSNFGRLEIDGTSQPGATVNTDAVGTNAQIAIELRNVSLLIDNSPDTVVRGLSLSTSATINQPLFRVGRFSRLLGNFIGVRSDGVTVGAAVNATGFIECFIGCGTIGDGTLAGRNLIANPTSGNISAIHGGTSARGFIRGNLIGVQRNGIAGLSNVASTVANPGAATTRAIWTRVAIGPGDEIRDNIIGSGIVGIRVEGQGALVQGNLIGGRIVAGTPAAFRSASAGVWINGGNHHLVTGNEIRNNGGDGVDVATMTTQAGITDNLLDANSGLGIDLGGNGLTPNDALDADTGANELQNFPVLATAIQDPSGVIVTGTLSSKPSTLYRLRFCQVATADATGSGECTTPIPAATSDVTTAADGTVAFTTAAFAIAAGTTAITATAAEVVGDHEMTSEFAQNATIRRQVTVTPQTNPAPSLAGQPFMVTVTVASTVGGSAPTGSVSVTTVPNVGSCTIASLSGGIGSCSITPAVAGPVTVTATYGGSATAMNGSGQVAHQVDAVPTTLTITNDAPDPSAPSAAFTVTFAVTATAGAPTGNVTVTASGGGSCTGAIAAGQGFCVLTPAGTGNLTLTADYPGSAIHLAAQDTESHDVGAAASTMAIQSVSPSPSVFGQPVTVTAQVSATVGSPSGPITISDGAGASCEIAAASGSCQLVPVNVGNDITLRAEFAGNAGHTGSFATTNHVVDRAEVIVTVGTPFRADTGEGQPAQFAPMRVPVAVAAAPPGAGTPGGTVIVESVLGSELCVIVLPETSCDLVPLTDGIADFTASYVGDTRFNERLEEFTADVLPAPLFGDGFECPDTCP